MLVRNLVQHTYITDEMKETMFNAMIAVVTLEGVTGLDKTDEIAAHFKKGAWDEQSSQFEVQVTEHILDEVPNMS